MIDPSWQPVEVTDLGGAITDIDAPDVPMGKALTANNCAFKPGGVETRHGFGTAYDVNEAVTSMDNWVSSIGNYCIYHSADSVLINHADNTEVDAAWASPTNASYSGGILTEDATAGVEHLINGKVITTVAGRTYAYYVDVKANGRTIVALSTNATATYWKAWFDISSGSVGTVEPPHAATITDIGGGWFRCKIQFVATVTGLKWISLYLAAADGATSYNGDGSSGVYFEAAKVTKLASLNIFDVSAPFQYTLVSDTAAYGAVVALAGSRSYAALFDADGKSDSQGYCVSYQGDYPTITADPADANWTKTASSISDDVAMDPDGGGTADKLVDTVADTFHFITHAGLTDIPDAKLVKFSVYLKAGEHTRAVVDITDRAQVDRGALFDLDAGVLVSTDEGTDGGIEDVGAGWYRCSITASVNSGSTAAQLKVFLDQGSGSSGRDHTFAGNGTDGIYVWNPTVGVFSGDALFSPPLTYTPSAPTEPSAGSVTAGEHRLVYAIEDRSGFIGRLCPDSGSGTPAEETVQPVEFTSAGSKNLSWVLNTTWPANAVKVHVAMTPVSNPALYVFVPGANAAVTGGASESHTITFDISDEDLYAAAGRGADATNHTLWYTQTTSNTGPFNPHGMFLYGDRMVYITEIDDGNGNMVGAAFASERNNYQQITPDISLIQTPGQLEITTGFALNGTAFLCTPNETYATSDNNLYPSQWPSAQRVGTVGTSAPRGVAVAPDAGEGGVAFVADKRGLFAFSGRYDRLPMSYLQSDVWESINWSYGYLVQVVDIPHLQTVAVAVPLGDATAISHILTWCYRKGANYAQADYSKWNFSSFDIGALALVENDLSAAATGNADRMELWVAPSDADEIRRQMNANDSTPWRDGTAGIPFTYRTGPIPGAEITEKQRHHGAFHRVTGSGTLAVEAQSVDGGWTKSLRSITLASAPDKNEWRPFHKMMPRTTYEYSHTAADAHVLISGFKHFVSPGPKHP